MSSTLEPLDCSEPPSLDWFDAVVLLIDHRPHACCAAWVAAAAFLSADIESDDP